MKCLAALLALNLLCSCSAPRRPGIDHAFDARIYTLPSAFFTNAILYKPVSGIPNGPAATLAPLLIWEVVSEAERAAPWESRKLYFSSGELRWHGRSHQEMSFFWLHSSVAHCVRITLSAAGAPVIWEVRSEPRRRAACGEHVFFVAESLEQAAAAEFGPPLAGRRYAIERSPGDCPQAIVARVVEDGPMPMGPMVYIDAHGAVTTILCRCMPAQVRAVADTQEYEMLPIEDLRVDVADKPGVWASRRLARHESGEELGQFLRLPSGF